MSSFVYYRQSVPKDTNTNEFFDNSHKSTYRYLKTLPIDQMSSTEPTTYSAIPSPSQVFDTLNPPNNTKMFEFYIGLGLAVSSSIFIGSSFIIKKKALKKLAETNTDCRQRASEGGYGYLKEWLWWMGVITMGVGEACNFAAYAFAPASLVTPLGALSVIVTAVLSSRLLDERLNLLGKIGCAVCLLGSTSIVIHSPKEEEVSTMADLAEKMKDPMFIIYVIVIIVVTLGIVVYVAPRYGRSNILVYISVCSLIGSLSVLSVKGLGLAIKETIAGDQQITNILTWFWLLCVIGCVSVQLIYLNKALDIYNTSMVTPIYYVFFTTFVILASGILYKEWSCLGASDILGNVIGFLTTIIGIFQMQLFRNVDISWRQLHILVHKQAMNGHLDLISSSASLVDYHNDNMINYNSNGKRSYHSPEPLCNIVAPASNNLNIYS